MTKKIISFKVYDDDEQKTLVSDNDLNKIVADSYFDVFAHSNGHMGMLLGDKNEWYGFGFVQSGGSFYIVIKASSDSSVK